ncbi:MAG: alpha-aminoadipate--LysW ligase LysX [Marine Group I thaumarchaeote]|nr:MAG: alpha-aminoadipate--LysW ligase LysX [Marine Group I thaumarchaeote]
MSSDLSILYDNIRWEEKALLEAGKKKNINIQMVDCKKLFLELDKKTKLNFGTVIQRCVSYYRNLHSTAALEGLGVKVINCLNTGILAGNKLFTHMLLQKEGVPTPFNTVAFSQEAALEALEKIGYPQVIKPTVGSWGRMISLLNDRDAAEGIMEMRERMYPIYQIYYLEEFVKRPPRDIRAIMVGNKVVAAIYRYSGDGMWRTNMALGGRAEECKVTNELEDICIKAKNAVNGEIVGVDLMESNERGLVVHEVNNTTEYKNTVRVTGVDIPTQMIDYALQSKK